MNRKQIDALLWVWDGRGQRPHTNTLRALKRGSWVVEWEDGNWSLAEDGSVFVRAYLLGFRDGSEAVR